MTEAIAPLSEYSMNAAREGIEEYRDSRDYPAKAGAMSALAIILYDEAVRARARLAQLESVLAEAGEALEPFKRARNNSGSELAVADFDRAASVSNQIAALKEKSDEA